MRSIVGLGLLLLACVTKADREAEGKAREAYLHRIDLATIELQTCKVATENMKHGAARATRGKELCAGLDKAQVELLAKLEEYRAACRRCAPAEKCESEVRRLRNVSPSNRASLMQETACPE